MMNAPCSQKYLISPWEPPTIKYVCVAMHKCTALVVCAIMCVYMCVCVCVCVCVCARVCVCM